MSTDESDVPTREWGWSVAVALLLAMLISLCWMYAGSRASDLGSACTIRYGEGGPKTTDCLSTRDLVNTWLPMTTLAAWLSVPLGYRLPRIAAVLALSCAVAAGVVTVIAELRFPS